MDLPVNGRLAMGSQKFVTFGKMPASEEAPVSRKGTGMGRFQNQVIGIVQEFLLLLGRPSPEHKDHGAVLVIEDPDGSIGKFFPAHAPVRIGLMGPDGKHRI